MKKTLYILVIVIILLAAALLIAQFYSSSAPQTLYSSYKTAAYAIDGKEIILGTEGTKYFGNEAVDDFNGDGTQDVAFLFTYQPGGSGTFYYLAVGLDMGRGFAGTNAILLGDRIAPQTTSVDEGDIIVNYADRQNGEPMTTKPSHGVTSYFKVLRDRLVMQGSR